MKKFLSISLSLISSLVMFSQPNPTDAESIIKAYKDKEVLVQSSRVKNIEFKNIGPTIMSGRVVALEVNPQIPQNSMLLMLQVEYGIQIIMEHHFNLFLMNGQLKILEKLQWIGVMVYYGLEQEKIIPQDPHILDRNIKDKC